jgi:hypothetical protein
LTGETILYCRWTIIRRRLSHGKNDQLANEVTTPFTVHTVGGTELINLEKTALHLSEQKMSAWTSQWEGLPKPIQRAILDAMGESVSDALYHCEQVLLYPNDTVTWSKSPAFLTDLDIPATLRWTLRRSLPPLALAGLLAITALSL